jgi:23S rRNA (cytidine1920-2'-O)/16S rRNA (cytidine1409-2'-O)-methyltransferase
MAKTRLDILLVDQGLVESRSLAQRLIMAGRVRVGGQVVYKPGSQFDRAAQISLDPGPEFVSRGGLKLDAAIQAFGVEVQSRVCADVGASTGGFTDCLLQHGASRVYAIDVARGQLHWKLRNDSRVLPIEGTNARHLPSLPEPVSLVVIDASFISLRLIIPVAAGWFSPEGGDLIALVKPQFEAGRQEASRGRGVIRDPEVHTRVLKEFSDFALSLGLEPHGVVESPLKGPKGNVEFLALLSRR